MSLLFYLVYLQFKDFCLSKKRKKYSHCFFFTMSLFYNIEGVFRYCCCMLKLVIWLSLQSLLVTFLFSVIKYHK